MKTSKESGMIILTKNQYETIQNAKATIQAAQKAENEIFEKALNFLVEGGVVDKKNEDEVAQLTDIVFDELFNNEQRFSFRCPKVEKAVKRLRTLIRKKKLKRK